MTSPERCMILWDLCRKMEHDGIEGNFVECGVWRGGSAGIMGLAMMTSKLNRTLHLFDSFEGLPEPTQDDGEFAKVYSGGKALGKLESVHQCEAGIEVVKNFLHCDLKLPVDRVKYYKGWFQDTVPEHGKNCGDIAVLRLDGDWYESTKICLDELYGRLAKGGVLLLDDYYAWEGCSKAADEFRERLGISDQLRKIDCDSAYWIKS